MNNMVNLEVDGLQQQKTMSGSMPVSQDQKFEAAEGTDKPKLESIRLEIHTLV